VVQILYSGLGGHSSVAFSLVEADKEFKYKHVLIFYGIEEMPPAYINKCTALGIDYFFIKKEPGFDRNAQKNVISTLKKISRAVILLHSISLIIPVYYYGFSRKTRVIAIEHQPNHLKTKLEWVWSFLLMRLSKKVVFLTDLYRDQMKKRLGIFYDSKKVRVINNGINIDLFKPQKKDKKFNNVVLKIGMLARLMDTKDHLTLIKAFKLLLQNNNTGRSLQLHIAGEGEMKQALINLTQQWGLGDDVHFRGMIPEAEAVDFLNELDIYVHASLGETMSTSIMQVMACGKPLIASNVEGINNMVRDKVTGILVPAKDETAMADSILRLMNNVALADELATNAYNFAVENYSNKKMLDNYKAIFTN